MNIKRGFTLAEVLITLAIIGVVAAMTMPGLIGNYRKKEYTIRLQKAVSSWDNAARLMQAESMTDYLADRNIEKYLNIVKEEYFDYFSKLKPLVANAQYPAAVYVDSGSVMAYLTDGTKLYIDLSKNTDLDKDKPIGTVVIDVNGEKPPNQTGRDTFFFLVDYTGTLVAYNSSAAVNLYHSENGANEYWKNNETYCGAANSKVIPSNTAGSGCAARIIENGWEMDY
ncbi:MAG: type II secretion system GspH family protein [Heliobacteriaceae bacterium]|jgi:prepilin-type N-terminal cleavage/methylation domain-containing protein|nr:type II secretion system GspH family protein [Heliobacteriaceae bacterium]